MRRLSILLVLAVAACSTSAPQGPQTASAPAVAPVFGPASPPAKVTQGGAAKPAAIMAPAPVAPVQASEIAAKPKKICKRLKATGSNVPQRVCSTKEEWDELERRALAEQEETKRMMGGMANGMPEGRAPPPPTIR